MRILLVVLVLLFASTAHAHKTAQGAAEASAKGGLCHRGGNPYYEGLGCASTPESAYRSCCYGSSTNLITYDYGIARGRNGLWVACRRYVSKSMKNRIPEIRRRAGLPEEMIPFEKRNQENED